MIPDEPVLYGFFFFFALKPIYVRHTTQKDIEMSVCKDNFHGRWSVETLVRCRRKHITPLFADYEPFFDFLSTVCPPGNLTYISWDCTKTFKTMCDHIFKKWNSIKDSIKDLHNDVTVPFFHFKYVEITKKNKEIQKYLETVQIEANISYLVNFIETFFVKLMHHRNMLLHYRSSIKEFDNLFESVCVHIDFSENVTLSVKHQA